jgi:hypothetical protein
MVDLKLSFKSECFYKVHNFLNCESFLDGLSAGGIGYGPSSYWFGRCTALSSRPWNLASSEGSQESSSSWT